MAPDPTKSRLDSQAAQVRNEQCSPRGLRFISVSVAVTLVGFVGSNTFAGTRDGSQKGWYGLNACYCDHPPETENPPESNEGLSVVEQGAIGVGAMFGVAMLAKLLTHNASKGADVIGGANSPPADSKLADSKKDARTKGPRADEVRLILSRSALGVGERTVLDLQVRGRGESDWQSVTSRDTASIRLRDEAPFLIRQEGTKNAFCVPITTPISDLGRTVTFVGSYTEGRRGTLTAEASVRLRTNE